VSESGGFVEVLPAKAAAERVEVTELAFGLAVRVVVQVLDAVVGKTFETSVELAGGPAPGCGCSMIHIALRRRRGTTRLVLTTTVTFLDRCRQRPTEGALIRLCDDHLRTVEQERLDHRRPATWPTADPAPLPPWCAATPATTAHATHLARPTRAARHPRPMPDAIVATAPRPPTHVTRRHRTTRRRPSPHRSARLDRAPLDVRRVHTPWSCHHHAQGVPHGTREPRSSQISASG